MSVFSFGCIIRKSISLQEVVLKKKPIYLYVLLGLATAGSLWGLVSKFSSSNDAVESLLKGMEEPVKSQFATYFSKSAELSGSLLSNVFFYASLLLLIAAWFFVFKKDIFKANLIYIANVLIGLIGTAYGYVVAKGIATSSFSDPTLLSTQILGLNMSVGFSVVLSLIFLSIVVFKLIKQQKEAETVEVAEEE